MVLLRRTSALVAVVTLSGLVESFLTLLGTRTSQTPFTRTLFSNSSVRGKDQRWVAAAPPCMRWLALVQASNLSSVSVSNRAVLRERGVP